MPRAAEGRHPPPHLDTFEDALREAVRMLREEFGEADQKAAVDLAQFLFTTHERQEFLARRGEPDEFVYGAQ